MFVLGHVQAALWVFSAALILAVVIGWWKSGHYLMEHHTSFQGQHQSHERRRADRRHHAAPLDILSQESGAADRARLVNLSQTGACLLTRSLLTKGEAIVLRFHTAQPSRFIARIMWANETQNGTLCGVRFERQS